MNKLIILFAIVLLTGCNLLPEMDNLVEDRKVEYKKSRDAQKDLEVPPDLTRDRIDNALVVPEIGGGSATFSEYSNERRPGSQPSAGGGVLTKVRDIELQRNGDKRWLLIKATPADVWPSLVAFWQENGVLLLEQDPEVGLMRTAWLENRADIKSDFITDAVRSVFDGIYSADTRDQFRIRLEEGPNGTTELYLTHRGMQEKIMTGSGNQSEQQVWVPRPTDHGLEAVMLRRIMIYLGVSEQRATAEVSKKGGAGEPSRSQLIRTSNEVALRISEDLERSWRLTGVALDRVGFAVEDRNRSDGVYFVRYNDPYADQEKKEGLLSKLAFWSDDSKLDKVSQYQVRLTPGSAGTEVRVHNQQGGPDNSQTAVRILTLLQEQIR